MLTQTEATIYLATQRGCSQGEWFTSYHTFNFGDYHNNNRKPIHNLIAVNEDTLSAGKTIVHRSPENVAILFLPLAGALHYKLSDNTVGSLDVGQAQLLCTEKNSGIEISNPYKNESINFIHIWLSAVSQNTFRPAFENIDFDLAGNKNKLIRLMFGIQTGQIPILIGQFEGRREGNYRLENTRKGIFTYVLAGAFEVQNRLLEPHDGLALWSVQEIEFEALSNDAVILMVELL